MDFGHRSMEGRMLRRKANLLANQGVVHRLPQISHHRELNRRDRRLQRGVARHQNHRQARRDSAAVTDQGQVVVSLHANVGNKNVIAVLAEQFHRLPAVFSAVAGETIRAQ